MENVADSMYGLQYHPEVQHSERGVATLRRFLFGIACIPADWKMENVLEEELAKIRAKVRAHACTCYPGTALAFCWFLMGKSCNQLGWGC